MLIFLNRFLRRKNEKSKLNSFLLNLPLPSLRPRIFDHIQIFTSGRERVLHDLPGH